MMTCPISGNTHLWIFGLPREGVHPKDGKAYAWYGGQCSCGMKFMMEKQLSDTPIADPREFL